MNASRPCDFAFNANAGLKDAAEGTKIRYQCSKHHPKLKLEWARFQMAKEWLTDCKECTGWSLVCDVKDSFFYHSPFQGLGPPAVADTKHNILIIEEWFGKPAGSPDHPRSTNNEHWFR